VTVLGYGAWTAAYFRGNSAGVSCCPAFFPVLGHFWDFLDVPVPQDMGFWNDL
jgi:hypothetical protein